MILLEFFGFSWQNQFFRGGGEENVLEPLSAKRLQQPHLDGDGITVEMFCECFYT